MMQAKSLILKFPTEKQVPKHLQRHFIRGYFDGDGCVTYNKKSKNVVFSFVGTFEMMTEIQKILVQELKFKFTKFSKRFRNRLNYNNYTLNYGGNIQSKTFSDWLYKDSRIHLERKYNKFKITKNCPLIK